MAEKQTVLFDVFRFNSETDYLPHYKQYEVEVSQDDVMLDILDKIKWTKDSTFSYRRSCRHGICGSCGVKVSGKSIIACKERVFDLIEIFGTHLTIDPQDKRRAIKDMVIDKADFWGKYDAVQPYLVSDINERPESEYTILPDEYEELDESDVCIQCGACYYACPANEVNENFLGPAAFAKAYRFNVDKRDDAKLQRLETVNELGSGIWDCVKCFECAEACPKGVNPIGKITQLHTMTFTEGVADNNVATRHAVGFKHSIEKHGHLDEGTLVLYSERAGIIKHIPSAIQMFAKGKVVPPWSMPKSEKLDEIKKLVKSSSRAKF